MSTFEFDDQGSGQRGFVSVRQEDDVVALSVSLQDDGDIEVFFGLEDAERLGRMLAELAPDN
ncbi:MAG: hypothetical protein U0R24_00865 [Solirubrobacterales bacterium]